MGEIIHRIDAPFVAGLMMFGEFNAVQHRVTHYDKVGRHIDFARRQAAPSANSPLRIFQTAPGSLLRCDRGKGYFTRRRQRAAIFADLLWRQLVDIGRAFIDQLNSVLIKLVEIIRGVTDLAAPLETQPLHVTLDGLNELDIFFCWVGIIKAQVALPLIIWAMPKFRQIDLA